MKAIIATAAALLLALPAWAQSGSSGGTGATGGGPSSSSRAPGPGITGEAGPANRPESTSRAAGPTDPGGRTGAVRPESFSRGAGPGTSGETATGELADRPGLTRSPPLRGGDLNPAPRAGMDIVPDTTRGEVPRGRQGVPEVIPDPGPPATGAGPTGRPLDLPR